MHKQNKHKTNKIKQNQRRMKSMVARMVGNKCGIAICVSPETYEAIEKQRGRLKRSTYCALVLDEIFNPLQKEA